MLHDVRPVLIVSEKTWPRSAFSEERSTRPSSAVITTPKSSGSGTRFRQS